MEILTAQSSQRGGRSWSVTRGSQPTYVDAPEAALQTAAEGSQRLPARSAAQSFPSLLLFLLSLRGVDREGGALRVPALGDKIPSGRLHRSVRIVPPRSATFAAVTCASGTQT